MRTNLDCKKALTTQTYELFSILFRVYDLKFNLNFEVMKFCSLKVGQGCMPRIHERYVPGIE